MIDNKRVTNIIFICRECLRTKREGKGEIKVVQNLIAMIGPLFHLTLQRKQMLMNLPKRMRLNNALNNSLNNSTYKESRKSMCISLANFI